MNILFLSELFFPHGGGAELATYEYAKLLNKNGVNVIVVTNRFSAESNFSENHGVAIYRLPLLKGNSAVKFQMLLKFDVAFSGFFRKLFKWADLVYIPRYWFSAIPIAKAYGKPVLVHLHDHVFVCPVSGTYNVSKGEICQLRHCSQKCIYTYEQNMGHSLKSALASTLLNSTLGTQLRRLIALSDGIICVSNSQKNTIASKFPSLREKISVIYNPMPEFDFTKIQGDDYGFLGGSNPIKGFESLRCAFAQIKGDIYVKLHATNFASPVPKSELMRHAKIVYYEKLTSAPLNELYTKVRAVIMPSLCSEPFPYVLCETILKGRLVITSNVGGAPEIAGSCKSAFFFKPGNCRELAEKIECVSSLSREIANDLAAQSRKSFLEKFDNDVTLNNFIAFCNKIVKAKT